VKRSAALLLALPLLAAACVEEAPALVAEPPPPPPPVELVVDTWPGTAATGRLAAFDISLRGEAPAFADGVRAQLGEQRAIVVPRGAAGRDLLVLAPIDIDEPLRELELRVEGELVDGAEFVRSKPIDITEAEYPTSELRVSRRFVEPNRKQRRRAKREKKRVKAALASSGDERLWRGPFIKPVPTQQTSPFGTARMLNGKRKSRHLGWDLGGRTGDPVRAAGRGRVALVGQHFYSGGTILLDHGQGLFTMYFHLSAIEVEEGALAPQGARIGRVGKSGRVTGPHLHFGVKVAGTYVDPEPFLAMALDG
jgi:murein DD-endopeptidase MepM/ murein hydrolase activator NlpD